MPLSVHAVFIFIFEIFESYRHVLLVYDDTDI